MTARYLADKSALARLPNYEVAEQLQPRIALSLVATCPIVDFEVLYSARNATEYEQISAERLQFPQVLIDPEVTNRSLEVQGLLARKGRHRLPIS
ncbi:MAG: hypothetical protein MK184_06240 [Acidimicrobiales bacterium]|nr:hypothetical protein [Acidimicrobiales bacterium]